MATTTDIPRTTTLSESKRALLARRLLGQANHTAARTIPRRPTGPIPLSPAQRAVWLADQLFDGGAAYTVNRTMTVRGVLDLDALRQAADLLVARHEILRTTIDGNHQVVHPAGPACFTVVSPPGATADQRRATALHEARLAVATPFDLEAGPLLRFTVYRVDDDEFLVVISQHHIITDGWSCALLAKELCETYTAVATGRPHQAPPSVQFGDVAAWQAAVPPERLREDLDYWADALSDLPDGLQLPLDRTRPPRRSDRGETFVAPLPASLSTHVRTLAGQRGSTVHNVLLTAYAALLSRYSTQQRFAVGSLLSGRGAPETEHALGLFANTVAIPVNLAGRPTFAEALARTNRAVRGALDHQDVAFDQIVARVGAVRDASRNPIFQVIFQCVEAAEETWQLPDAVVQHIDLDNGTAKVDLTMIAVNSGTGEMGLELSFATDLFERATIDRFFAHFVALLEQVVAEPDAPLDSVELVTGAERDTMLHEWNDTEITYPDRCVHELFERQAAATPLATAIIEQDGTAVSYAQLNARANRIAHLLRERGVGVEDVVGLCLPQSTDLHAALLGILKAGGCYLPLDPAHPAERQRYMLSDAGARILLTAADTQERFADFDGERICVPTEDLSGYAETDPEAVNTPNNLIYIMYTSGSTGRPKGVLVTHRGVANYLLWSIDGYGVQGTSGAPMVGSIAFDLSVPNFLLPLISGRDVTLLPETDQVQALADLIQRDGDFSLLKITPGHLDALRHLTPAGSRVNSVRTYVVGADEVRPETVAAWREIAPQGRIINEYGPTETVVGCSVYEIGDDFDPASPISIGRPIANLRMYVLDAQGRLAPPGVVGELYIGGVGVARGYAGRPALTAERFVPDPYDPLPGARMYRTGDLARFRLDGNIDFLGRIDHQVKIRGYRVELAEVEARLLAHPEVTEAVVVCREAGGHQRLAAYVVGAARAAVAPDGVKRFVAAGLPDYMVPSVVTVLDQMPLTAGGKVDRGALPEPALPDADQIAAPRTPAEQTLTEIWQTVLGVPRIGIHANFFDLGGDSLLSVRVARQARDAGLAVTPALLFGHQSIAELAEAVAGSTTSPVAARPGGDTAQPGLAAMLRSADLPPVAQRKLLTQIRPAGIADLYRLSPLQAGMLFQTLAEPERAANVEQFVIGIDGDLRPDDLRYAWQHGVDRHPVLRTTFAWRELPHPVQVVAPVAELDWDYLDWSHRTAAECDAELARLLAADREQGFALDLRPPHRCRLIRTGPAAHLLVWSFHHLLLDGWSMPVLVNEILLAYHARTGRVGPQLPEPVPFGDYIRWLWAQDTDASMAFWRERLLGATPTDLPFVRPAATRAEASAAEVTAVLDRQRVEDIRALARRHRVTVGTVLQAAWALLLARETGDAEVMFGTLIAGRDADVPGIERIVGLLMSTVPNRVRVAAGSLGHWLQMSQANQAAANGHGHLALADIQRAAGHAGGRPLFETIFVYENFDAPAGQRPPELDVHVDRAIRQTGYPVVLGASLHEELTLRINYDRARVSAAESLLDEYVEILDGLLADTEPEKLASPSAVRVTGARTPLERRLAEIWAEVLHLVEIGIGDDFIELGGDSIRAMQIVARARDIGLIRRPTDLFSHPTVAQLAAMPEPDGTDPPTPTADPAPSAGLGPAGAASADSTGLSGLDEASLADLMATLPADEVEGVYALAPLQVSMLFEHLAAERDIYQRTYASDIDGPLDADLLRRAWQHATDRHPALRTRYLSDGLPRPVQVVLRRHEVVLERHDCTHVPAPARAAWIDRLLARELDHGAGLDQHPPSRFFLIRTGERSHRFVWSTHHVVMDGYSFNLVFAEVSSAYRALREGRPLPAGSVPVEGYVRWLRTPQTTTADDGEFWRDMFAGLPAPSSLPLAEPVAGSAGSASQTRTLPDELLTRLQVAARRERVTLHTLLHCAWGLLLSEHDGGRDAVFGTTLAGRNAPVSGVEQMVGMFMNILPTRLRIDRAAQLGPWLRHTQEEQLALHDRVATALGDVRKAIGMSRGTPFTSLFVFRNFNIASGELTTDLSVSPLDVEVGETGRDLTLSADFDGGLRVGLKYNRSVYRPTTIERLLDRLTELLELLAGNGGDTVLGAVLPEPVPTVAPVESPEEAPHSEAGAAFTGRARVLKDIWDAVLQMPDVDPDENFFHVGGDSILAFQVAGAARRAQIPITVQQILRLRTFTKVLAAVDADDPEAGTDAPSPAESRQAVSRPAASGSLPDDREQAVRSAMARHRVPAASIALIENGEVAQAWTAGVTKAGGTVVAGPETVFQVCSVSKHVTALGVLRLVRDGLLDLDVDARDYLSRWQPPDDGDGHPITLRQLLSHTSGLTRLTNLGVARTAASPSLLDILHGSPPATNPAVRREGPAGEFRYSCANFGVIQQILAEVTGEPFAVLMDRVVFTPMGMTNSSYDQSFPLRRAGRVALGHTDDGGHLPGGWHVVTDGAASGLWTTATDLAKLACDVLRALRGEPAVLLGPDEAATMTQPLPSVSYGLGSIATGSGWFGHAGDGPGYQALTLAGTGGAGAVILANRAGQLDFVTDLMAELGIDLPVSRDGALTTQESL
ncbi:non-ribosomal peptide synthetase [Micromonospora parathelypteridis]|uniref:Amino acid adenylation domain-containing protein n=1 Tax=Micromonospora parathelypteridis TaxID=1839617 RepID=A0A840W445_9ACTN|nr:non-ribosomal peptide synthetase [Micromonospora parathelypteridis]MBB5480804.1 amino acid adenylation domain-containing protein [Micromonospora parathelypteridis]GGO21535.1 hypothetical protein GCM10011576_39980 [Micromonospora parathelypteridis]